MYKSFEAESEVNKKINDALKANPDPLEKNIEKKNLMKFITPYYSNRYQKEMLSHILGKNNISKIEEFNALVYSGLINPRCSKSSEKYIDAITGKVQCRTKLDPMKRPTHACPTVNDSPFNIEPYVDAFGNPKCRKPVRIGEFACPPKDIYDYKGIKILDNSMRTKHVTLPDGTGMCVNEPSLSSASLMPTGIIDTDLMKMKNYMSIFNNLNLSQGNVKVLADLLKSPGLIESRNVLLEDPQYAIFNNLMRNIFTSDDQRIANIALYQYVGGMNGGRLRHRKSKKSKRRSKSAGKKIRHH